MISLVSTWPLKDGCPPELQQMLEALAPKVEENEPGTLMYLVNLEAASPLNAETKPIVPPPPPIPLKDQKAVIFIEMYENAQAFSEHVLGSVFQTFLTDTKDFFIPDAAMTSSTRKNTPILARQSGFVRPEILSIINS